jgi:hypothetical protein
MKERAALSAEASAARHLSRAADLSKAGAQFSPIEI